MVSTSRVSCNQIVGRMLVRAPSPSRRHRSKVHPSTVRSAAPPARNSLRTCRAVARDGHPPRWPCSSPPSSLAAEQWEVREAAPRSVSRGRAAPTAADRPRSVFRHPHRLKITPELDLPHPSPGHRLLHGQPPGLGQQSLDWGDSRPRPPATAPTRAGQMRHVPRVTLRSWWR